MLLGEACLRRSRDLTKRRRDFDRVSELLRLLDRAAEQTANSRRVVEAMEESVKAILVLRQRLRQFNHLRQAEP